MLCSSLVSVSIVIGVIPIALANNGVDFFFFSFLAEQDRVVVETVI